MRVSFLTFSKTIASARYRQQVPIRELTKLGWEITPKAETIVVSKHGWDESILKPYKKVVYDICDDHLSDEYGGFYRKILDRADLAICNSPMMQWRIWQETGHSSLIIPDPYEGEEKKAQWGEGLCWFGHQVNLPDLFRETKNLRGYGLSIVSQSVMEGITPWSPEAQADALDKCAVVILPTGKSPCKSANRMIEALRAGKFVVANPLPAYAEFSPFCWIGDIRQGVDWAHANQDRALDMVKAGQDHIRNRFSPERIGRLWSGVLSSLGPS